MTELAVWLVVGVFILSALYAALPFILSVAAIAFAAWALSKIIESVGSRQRAAKRRQQDIIDRAERQHRHIMVGDEDAGTYGEYPPCQF